MPGGLGAMALYEVKTNKAILCSLVTVSLSVPSVNGVAEAPLALFPMDWIQWILVESSIRTQRLSINFVLP